MQRQSFILHKIHSLMKNIFIAFLLLSVLNLCAQPVDHYNRFTFRLSDDMESYYSLCQLDYKNIHLDSLSCDAAEKILVSDKNEQIFFEYTKYEPVSLVLYKNNEKMILLFKNDLFNIETKCDLGTIPFSPGTFYIGGEVLLAIKEEKSFILEDSRLLFLDSLHYCKKIKNKENGALSHMIIYSKDGAIKKWITVFDNQKTAKEYYGYDQKDFRGKESTLEHYAINETMFIRDYYKDLQSTMPKHYYSSTEEIDMDSLGYITNRIIYDKVMGHGGIIKKYQQQQQIGKHYTEIQSSLPPAIFYNLPVYTKLYDDFVCSPVIDKSPFLIQLSHVGYFPQDTLDLNKFQAFRYELEIKVSFQSGADKIGEPLIVKSTNREETVLDIYFIESKASADMEWTRELIIPLEIGADEIFKINFPVEANPDLKIADDFDFAPRWILLGLNGEKVSPVPLIIYGRSDKWNTAN